ncbi:MAG TPA: FmdB family zinc ribbon protein [Ramlibacter sp.]|nr:FmdB family zinc ribbon protein [Ramlibacter sp.]
MPIYAYKCASCGFAKDVLQKISDAPLTDCPQCGAQAFNKQITAAGFQLKGSGWYATDFRGGAKTSSETDTAKSESKSDTKSDSKSDSKSESKPADTPKSEPPSAAGGCGASCACH